MNTDKSQSKNSRKIRSFEAEADVDEMLSEAQKDGFTLGDICNMALRKYGPAILAEMAAEISKKSQKWAQLNPVGRLAAAELLEQNLVKRENKTGETHPKRQSSRRS